MRDELRAADDSFETLIKKFGGEKVPERELDYFSPENKTIHDVLFSKPLQKGQVIGPIEIDDGQSMILKIKGWTNRVVITERDINQRWNDVKEKLTQEKALEIYEKFVAKVMRKQEIRFSSDSFYKLAKLMAPIYLQTQKVKEELFLDKTFNREGGDSILPDDFGDQLDALRDQPLFKLNGQVWTVADFQDEIEKHPLVFRKKKIKNGEFAEQFELAIVDMMRDRALAKVAYKRGYDTVPAIKRNVDMWQDAMLAQQQKYQYLKDRIPANGDSLKMMQVINEYLNPYIETLQKKYADQVQIEVKKFNELKLTRIDMFVTQQNVPFPIVVPSFPQLTTDYQLDYGKKME